MGKKRDPKRAEAEQLWMDSGGKQDIVDIAASLGVPDGTVRCWKSKDNWEATLNGEKEPKPPGKSEKSKRNVPISSGTFQSGSSCHLQKTNRIKVNLMKRG